MTTEFKFTMRPPDPLALRISAGGTRDGKMVYMTFRGDLRKCAEVLRKLLDRIESGELVPVEILADEQPLPSSHLS